MNVDKQIYYHNSFSETIRKKGYDVSIYRYIPLLRLHELLISKSLQIGQTVNWDDTYENFLAKAEYSFSGTPISYREFIPGFYGQCWTLGKETDALWRIYSPNKTGVRIKSRINKVLEASLKEIDYANFSTRTRIIGPVCYLTKRKISNWIQGKNQELIKASTLLESLFIKRREFSHEKEIRLIIHKNIDLGKPVSNFLNLKIDPNELIEEITFDPRIKKSEFELSKKLIRKIGFENKVNKSKLYEFEQAQID